jgi:hypothetical protein
MQGPNGFRLPRAGDLGYYVIPANGAKSKENPQPFKPSAAGDE